MRDLICTVTPSILDGYVVRWYFPDDENAGLPNVEPAISASYVGVRVNTYLHLLPEGALDAATQAYEALKRNRRDEGVRQLATHERKFVFHGPLVEIER